MNNVLGSVWFGKIGIVLMNNGSEDKAYIGIGRGIDERTDETIIMNSGKPFPVKQAKEMIQYDNI
jgi:hypothetical protein